LDATTKFQADSMKSDCSPRAFLAPTNYALLDLLPTQTPLKLAPRALDFGVLAPETIF